MNCSEKYKYKGVLYEIYTGPKGGTYIIINNKKKYVNTQKHAKVLEKENNKKLHRSRNSILNVEENSIKYCCCCGKPLSRSDCNYYDLEDYCPRCALNDRIITSLE